MKLGYTYLIKQKNKYKIGYTTNLVRRMSQYKTHNCDFNLLYVIKGNQEKELHKRFEKYKVYSEWFNANDEILLYFKNNGIFNLTNNSILVFSFMCMKADSDGLINITGPFREELKSLMELSEASIVKALKELIDNNIIEKDSRGWYRINPNYAWKGTQVQRSKLLKNSKCVVKIEILPNEKVMK